MPAFTDFRRDVLWYVEKDIDRCAETFGSAPCTGTGTSCYYSRATCKDPDNYNKGTWTVKFTEVKGPQQPPAYPLIKDVQHWQTIIRPDESLTAPGNIQIVFSDMEPTKWACPGKPALTTQNNLETAGSFWKNLKARNPNYKGRDVRVYVGLRGWDLSAYILYFKGIMENIVISQGEVKVKIKDRLKKLDQKAPKKQGSDNLLTSIYNGGATMDVTDGSEFMDPSESGGECVVKVEDEYVTYTGISSNQLTGCSPGAYGTTAASHAVGKAVKNVLVVADDNAAASWDDVDGMPACYCLLSLLCSLGGIAAADTATVDYSITLNGAIAADASSLVVSDGTDLPYRGVLKINNEFMYFSSRSGTTCSGLKRGLFNTAAAAHGDGDDVYVSEFSDQAGRWMAANLYKRRAEKGTSLKDLVKELREGTNAHVWQGEDSYIHCKMAPTALYDDTPLEATDSAHFCEEPPVEVDDNEDARRTAITVAYNPNQVDAAEDKSDQWDGFLVHWNPALEDSDYLDAEYRQTLWCPWIYREAEALLCASYRLLRRQYGMPLIYFALDLKDAADLDAGDFIKATTSDLVDKTGAPRSNVTCEVLSKERVSDTAYKYTAVDITGGVDGARHGVISPSTVTHDYDSATEEEKERHCWVSDSDDKVGAAGDDGYDII
jgi:hypothetical protein